MTYKDRITQGVIMLIVVLLASTANASDSGMAHDCHLRFATTEYPPYSSQLFSHGGAMNMATVAMFDKIGCQVSIDYLPWPRVYIVKNLYDGILLLWPKEVQAMSLLGYQPIFTSHLGFFGLSNRQFDVSSEQALKRYRIGITRGYGYPDRLLKSGFKLDVTHDDHGNIKKLLAGHVDLIALEKAAGQYLFNEEYQQPRDKISWQEPSFADIPLGIAIVAGKPHSADYVQLLARAVALSRKSGELEKIARQFDVDPYLPTAPSR